MASRHEVDAKSEPINARDTVPEMRASYEALETRLASLQSEWSSQRAALQAQVYRLEQRAEKLERQRDTARQDARAAREALTRTPTVRALRLLRRSARHLRPRD